MPRYEIRAAERWQELELADDREAIDRAQALARLPQHRDHELRVYRLDADRPRVVWVILPQEGPGEEEGRR